MSGIRGFLAGNKKKAASNTSSTNNASAGGGSNKKLTADEISRQRMAALDNFENKKKLPDGRAKSLFNSNKGKKISGIGGKISGNGEKAVRHSMFPTGSAAKNPVPTMNTKKKKKAKRRVIYKIKQEKFVLYDYYTPTRILGHGAYASVCEAVDRRTGKSVAIKKNKGVFQELTDAKRILREIKLLQHFKHDDIIDLIGVIPPAEEDLDTFDDVYLVITKMETTLAKVIKSKQKLTDRHFQFFIYQMLRGLKYMHSAGVIHRDLKPENILINGGDCNLKITDFGLARGVARGDTDENQKESMELTEYVVTRWYRAPEVMTSARKYDAAVDIWSVGCIFAELLLRKPLFPGGNHIEQLKIIFAVMGRPKDDQLDWIKTPEAKRWVMQMKQSPGRDLNKIFSMASPQALDLLKRMLQLDPTKRITVNKALEHPYLAELHDPAKETTCERFEIGFEFEASINTKFGVRHMMAEELKSFKKNQKAKLEKKKAQAAATKKAKDEEKEAQPEAPISG